MSDPMSMVNELSLARYLGATDKGEGNDYQPQATVDQICEDNPDFNRAERAALWLAYVHGYATGERDTDAEDEDEDGAALPTKVAPQSADDENSRKK